MIGSLLNERYRLDAELGRGAMGVVYGAHDDLLDRDVAVKVLSGTGLGSGGRARLLREARAAARLSHPNIVSVFDAGEADGLPFIVMELVDGLSLHDQPPQSIDQVLSIARQVCAALDHAHANGIVHRDLKPENVLVTADGAVKLTDFGLARSRGMTRLTQEGTIVGTVSYLAPEQALGHEVDGRADLYSFGVMLYELTTGRLPFAGDDPVAVISQHLQTPVVPPRAHNADIPVPLDELIVQLMSKRPDDRPHSAAEVLRAIETLQDTLRIGQSAQPAVPAEEPRLLDRIARGLLVGRETELAEMKTVWKRAASGEGHVLLLSGEPGIGKTRLARELMTHVQLSGARALLGECYAEGGPPYAAVAQMIREAFEDPSMRAPNLPVTTLADLITICPSLRSRYPEVPPNAGADPVSEQQRVFESVAAWCAALEAQAPLMLLVDDVHWADSGALSLLRHLARRTRKMRVLIVATYREVELDAALPWNEVMLDLNRERLATRIKVGRLSREQTGDLLASMFGEEITSEFLDSIYRETEGNPFFVEEVCKALIEEGKLYYQDGRWHRPSMEEMQVPQSVRIAIQTRVSKLAGPTQETLRLAAVLGREFDFETLQAAGDLDEESLITALEAAEKAQLIEEIRGGPPGRVGFAFVHALIPSTLRESVSGLRRQRMHRRAAAAIERVRPDRFEALAFHFRQAGDTDRARTYYARAGARDLSLYANRDAERNYRAALDLGGSEPERAELLSGLGQALRFQSRGQEAIETWRDAIDLYRSLGDHDAMARLFALSGHAAWEIGDVRLGLTIGREGLAAAKGQPESVATAALLHEVARACYFNGLPAEALPLCKNALEIAEREKAVEVEAESLTTLGLLLQTDHQYDEAMQAYKKAAALAESAALWHVAGRVLNNMGELNGEIGDLRAARDCGLQSAEFVRRVGMASAELFAFCNSAYFSLWLGEFDAVEAKLPHLSQLLGASTNPGPASPMLRGVEIMLRRYQGNLEEEYQAGEVLRAEARRAGALDFLTDVDNELADMLLEAGKVDQAEEVLAEAVDIGDRGVGAGGVWPRCLLSAIRARQGRLEESRQLLGEARQKHADRPSALDRVLLLLAQARSAAAQRQWGEALAAFEACAKSEAQMGRRWYYAQTLREWVEVLVARDAPGDRGHACELLREAQTVFEEINVKKYAEMAKARMRALTGTR